MCSFYRRSLENLIRVETQRKVCYLKHFFHAKGINLKIYLHHVN